jgi:hypothetical protein
MDLVLDLQAMQPEDETDTTGLAEHHDSHASLLLCA